MNKIETYRRYFISEYGERKYRRILSKISNSKKVLKLITQSDLKQLSPNQNDFLYTVIEIPFFTFSRADTLAMGTLLALEIWHNTLNKEYYFLDKHDLDLIVERIIHNCNRMKWIK